LLASAAPVLGAPDSGGWTRTTAVGGRARLGAWRCRGGGWRWWAVSALRLERRRGRAGRGRAAERAAALELERKRGTRTRDGRSQAAAAAWAGAGRRTSAARSRRATMGSTGPRLRGCRPGRPEWRSAPVTKVVTGSGSNEE
jgi:hypothetical protein